MGLNKFQTLWLVVLTALLFIAACKHKTPHGVGYRNYPDMNMIVRDNLSPFKTFPKDFLLITGFGAQKDSQRMAAKKIDWSYFESALLKTNIYGKEFDHYYTITPVSEEMSTTITYVYESTDKTLPTKKIQVVLDAFDNKVQSIYIDYSNPGFFSSESYRILFVYGKFIQVQERSKRAFQKIKESVKQINFMD